MPRMAVILLALAGWVRVQRLEAVLLALAGWVLVQRAGGIPLALVDRFLVQRKGRISLALAGLADWARSQKEASVIWDGSEQREWA